MTALLVPVMSRFAKAWPSHAEQPCAICTRNGKHCTGPDIAEPFAFERAFSERFDDDPHFVAYAPVDDHRLDGDGIGRVTIEMQLLVVDVEPAGHAPRTPEWDAQEADKIQRAIEAGAFFYSTRGGYRLIWKLATPFRIESKQDAARWSASYLAALDEIEREFGIVGDRTCKDWTRLYRLPFVTRDGVAQEPEVSDVGKLGHRAMRIVDAPAPTTTIAPTVDSADPVSPELLQAVRDRLNRHGPAIEGKNGDDHTFQACAIVCRGWGLSDEQACALLDEWNQTCVPPWDADELRAKMDNAYNYGSGDIGAERSSWQAEQRIRAWRDRQLAGTEQRDTATTPTPREPTTAATTLDDLGAPEPEPNNPYEFALRDVRRYMGTAERDANEDFALLFSDAGELFTREFPPTVWRVKELILDGGTAVISTEPKSAKTWLATEIAVAVSTGTKVAGVFETIAGNVLYLYSEDMGISIRDRIGALLAGRGLTPAAVTGKLFCQPRGHHVDIMRDEDCARIIASARIHEERHGKVALLTLDPLRNIHSLDEDKSGEMKLVFERLKMIGTILGCIVMIVHHAKKATQGGSKRGGQKMRGSSAIHGFVDSGIYLDNLKRPDPCTFVNDVESEIKGGRSAERFELTLEIVDDAITRTARKATWSVAKAEATTAAASAGVSELSGEILRALLHAEFAEPKHPARTAKEIRKAVGGKLETVNAMLGRLERPERLVVKNFVGKRHSGWLLTDKGRSEAKAIEGRGRE